MSTQSIAASDPDPEISDDDPAETRALAVVVWVIQRRWDRVEDGCLSLLATARRKRGDSR
jgi:hypothetical protein